MPGMSTILDHLKAVSNPPRHFIFDAQIRMIIGEELDDFAVLELDSTVVAANSAWPTDSSLISRLVERLKHRGNSLEKLGLNNIHPRNFEHLIKEMKSLSKQIAFEVGKKGSAKWGQACILVFNLLEKA